MGPTSRSSPTPWNHGTMKPLNSAACHGGDDRMAQYKYTAVFEPAEEGGYVVTVPALPGLVTEGDTLDEARKMVKDAIRGYLESLVKHGEEIPLEPNPASI